MPSSISGTNFAGSLTNFFIVVPPGWSCLINRALVGACTPNLAQMSFSIVAIATMPGSGVFALRSPVNCCRPRFATHGVVRSIASFAVCVACAKHVARIGVLGRAVAHDVADRNHGVEQRLVAQLRAAAFLDSLDGRREHLVEILERDARAVLAQRSGAHEARAPDRSGAAADVLRDDHADLQQERADRASVEILPILLDDAEAARE